MGKGCLKLRNKEGRTAEATPEEDKVGVEQVSTIRRLNIHRVSLGDNRMGIEGENLPPLSHAVVLLEEALVVGDAVFAVEGPASVGGG